MNQTDLSSLLNYQTRNENRAAASRNVALPPSPAPPQQNSPTHPHAIATSDSVELSPRARKHNAASSNAASPDARAAKQMAERMPDPARDSYADILKILNENAPNVFKSMRAIIAQRAGVVADGAAGPDPELLAKTLKMASEAPDPSRRIADVVQGVGLVPPDQQDAFLAATQAILGWEHTAAAKAVSTPLDTTTGAASSDAVAPPSGQINVNPQTGAYQPQAVVASVEVNFDLFFSISAQSSLSSQSDASGAFYQATQSVDASFSSNFSLEIAGKYLTLADAANAVDPKVLDAFSQAVQGLAGLDQNALNRFFTAADNLFNSLETGYGLGNTALDGMAKEVKATAESFFQAVSSATQNVFPGMALDQIFNLPSSLDSNGSTDLLTLLGDLAVRRDPDKHPHDFLSSLNAAENARSLNAPTPSLDQLALLMKVDPALAA